MSGPLQKPGQPPSGQQSGAGLRFLPAPCRASGRASWKPQASTLPRRGSFQTLTFSMPIDIHRGRRHGTGCATRLETTTLALRFCTPEFTISHPREIYGAVWGRRETSLAMGRRTDRRRVGPQGIPAPRSLLAAQVGRGGVRRTVGPAAAQDPAA